MTKYFFLILLGIFCVIAIVRYIQFVTDIKIGKRLAASATAFSFTLPNPRARLLIIGDSTAVGTGVTDPNDSIAGKFHRDFPDIEIVNISRNGAHISEIATMLNRASGNFDVILIQGGGNDIIYLAPRRQASNQFDGLLKAAKNRAPEVVSITSGNIGAAPIFPWPLNWLYSYRSKIFLGQFKKIAFANGVHFVDLYQPKAGDPLRKDIKRFYASDGLHLTGDGYETWYQKILETLGEDNPLRG